MDILFEQHAIQNTGLAAETIWQAVESAYEAKHRTEGVPFALAFLVLPLTFHELSAKALASKTQPGALYKALADEREITVGLQSRMLAMSDRTLKGLSIGFHTGLYCSTEISSVSYYQEEEVLRSNTLPRKLRPF